MGFRKSSISSGEYYEGQHRFEHWYRDNSIYFITSRCRNRFNAFASEEAKTVFWDRYEFYIRKYAFIPIVTSLMDNHYHGVLYVRNGENVGPFMRHFHGSVAKLVNDVLEREGKTRLKPFWYDTGKQAYFDGILRDEKQHRRAHRYVWLQSVRHGIVKDPRNYPHTRENVKIDVAVKRAHQRRAYMEDVSYKRYER
jgi:REP element-mobilizing transposase RayT